MRTGHAAPGEEWTVGIGRFNAVDPNRVAHEANASLEWTNFFCRLED